MIAPGPGDQTADVAERRTETGEGLIEQQVRSVYLGQIVSVDINLPQDTPESLFQCLGYGLEKLTKIMPV